MILALILVAVTWLLLRLERKGLGAIGLDAPGPRLRQLAGAALFAGGFGALQQVGRSLVAGVGWELSSSFGVERALEHVGWWTSLVVCEELAFRGYLLFQAIRWLGAWRGALLSAAAFGVHHVATADVVAGAAGGSFFFLYAGAFGFLYAMAFAGTGSLAAPIGLHLGWNLATLVLFSGGPLGPGLLVPAGGAESIEVAGLAGALVEVGLPLAFVGVGVWRYGDARHWQGAS